MSHTDYEKSLVLELRLYESADCRMFRARGGACATGEGWGGRGGGGFAVELGSWRVSRAKGGQRDGAGRIRAERAGEGGEVGRATPRADDLIARQSVIPVRYHRPDLPNEGPEFPRTILIDGKAVLVTIEGSSSSFARPTALDRVFLRSVDASLPT